MLLGVDQVEVRTEDRVSIGSDQSKTIGTHVLDLQLS